MALTDVNLFRIDGTVGSIPSADIDVIKNAASISNNIVLNSDGTTTLTPSNIIKSSTAQASTSGTAIDFTGIPSWVKRITVMFDGVSTNGTSDYIVQFGAGSVTSSGYTSLGNAYNGSNATASATSTAGFVMYVTSTTATVMGHMLITNVTGNTWISSHSCRKDATSALSGGGRIDLSGTLDRVRITTANGTDTFDAGTINILYEG